MTTLHGIPNCDTIKKARKWLNDNDVEYTFHDYKKVGIERKLLESWANKVDWELLLNRRGTTWRKVPENVRNSIDKHSAIDLMLENPSMIKRPVLIQGNDILVGFDADAYAELLS